ncbi:MAG: anthranilate phosphoribosyltransferase [Acidimicrobiales bacterium]|jgi:anthranilate phosphoribosyltransferase
MASEFETAGGWPRILGRVLSGQDLTAEEAACALDQVLEGVATPAQIAAFVAGLRVKGESVEEMIGLVRAMRAHGERLEMGVEVVDTCGTGGDRSGTINVSTLSALVVAGAGAVVCKHGGRAASSLAGSADVLEALGVVIDLGPEGVRRCIDEAGIGFCFAPRFHPAMRFAAPIRREMGVVTVFNFIGPLVNPAGSTRQLVGVSDPVMAIKMLHVLETFGSQHAIVVFGHDGLDELTTTAPSTMIESVREPDGTCRRRRVEIDAASLGLKRAALRELKGGDAAHNAQLGLRILDGERGAMRDLVCLNAAAGLIVAGLADDLSDGLEIASVAIDDGNARSSLDRLVAISKAASEAVAG